MKYPKTFIQLPDIPEQIKSASHAYEIAFSLARAGDVLGWRKLVKSIRPNIFKDLDEWRQDELDGQESTSDEPFKVADKAVEIISPLIVVALTGVESGKEEFRNQKSLFDDLQNLAKPNLTGVWDNIPHTLGYVYHILHGSISLSTNQLDLAMGLVRVKIPDRYSPKRSCVWEMTELMGWSELFGPNCVKGWEYIIKACERWEWLAPIFGDELEYKVSLVAYYMALNIHELAAIIASSQQEKSNASNNIRFSPQPDNIPLLFMSENHDIYQRAISLLRRNPDAVTQLWTSLNVTHEQMKNSWRSWVSSCDSWLRQVARSSSISRQAFYRNMLDHQDFFEML